MLVCLFMGAAGILLDRHNAQGPGILTFIPGALIAILAPRRGESDTAAAPSLASVLLAMAIAVPVVVMGAANVAFHFVTAEGAPSGNIAVAGLQGIIAPDAPTSTPNQPGALAAGGRAADVCGLVDALPSLQANKGEHPLSPTQILAFVADGAALLQRTPQLVGKAFVPDLGNPLNALAGRPAPRGAEAFNDAEITFSKAVHRPAEQLFADADVLMIPKFAQKYATFDLMRQIYGAYWAANFELVARSPCWDGYRRIRRPAPAARPGT
jgi:hypothetical protein